jgi:uncharacterized protein (DUF849 family)
VKRKVILTCAVVGEGEFNRRHPSFPITPAQIAAAAEEAASAGASAVHLHARDPETAKGSRDPELYREIVDRVRSNPTDVVINVTCGGNANFYPDPADPRRAAPDSDIAGVDDRVRHIELTRPEICSLDVTTGNQVDGARDYVYMNPADTLREMARRFRALGVKPEIEVFSPGDILFVRRMIEEGLIDGAPFIQMVLGVKWAAPADVETVLYMRNLMPKDAIWGAFGIAQLQMPMLAQSLLLGGNARVGLEDNLYLERGVFATNGQLVERARRLIEDLGCEIASPTETRAMLGLRSLAAPRALAGT